MQPDPFSLRQKRLASAAIFGNSQSEKYPNATTPIKIMSDIQTSAQPVISNLVNALKQARPKANNIPTIAPDSVPVQPNVAKSMNSLIRSGSRSSRRRSESLTLADSVGLVSAPFG